MKQRRLVVISLDSLGFADLNEQRDLTPNLNRLIAQGTWVKKVRGIFPTLTNYYWAVSSRSWYC